MANIPLYNSYTPLATFSGNVINGIYTLTFDNLPVAQQLHSCDIGENNTVLTFEKPLVVDADFGAHIVCTCSTNRGGVEIDIHGYDYLGQPVSELGGMITTKYETKKAFKYITAISIQGGVACTITIKRELKLGLPYSTTSIIQESRDGKKVTTSTLTEPLIEILSSDLTPDPRGTIDLKSYTKPAVIKFICTANTDTYVIDGKEVGGLFGIPHYSRMPFYLA